MINYGIQHSIERPREIEVTADAVFIASNIVPYSTETEGHTITGFAYNYRQYDKDEYIAKLHQDIVDTQMALCDLYEQLDGE